VGQTLDFVVQTGLAPELSVAIDRALLAEAASTGGVLRVYDFPGDVLALGRYHLTPAGGGAAVLHRRLSGGRVMSAGEGFVALALVLPHRSALVSADPFALAPAQVINRYVRGILEGLKSLGVNAFYPGRDAITVDRRIIGLVSFEVDGQGALLLEAILGGSRDFSCLPALLDAADPDGAVGAALLTPADTTCLARELGRAVGLDEVAAAIRLGYEARLGVRFENRSIDGRGVTADPRWTTSRRRGPELDRRATTHGQLGVLEAHVACASGRLGGVLLAGDFIANSPAIAELEARLTGCAATPAAIDAVVRDVFAPAANFILGIGLLSALTDTVVRGAGG